MEDAVKSQLNSQLEALKSQYELGLISRSEYEKQAEKYASVADNKLYEIEKEMNEKLAAIENNTGDTANNIKASIQKVSGLENFNPSDHLMAEPSFDDSKLQPYIDTVERADNITAPTSSGSSETAELLKISQNDYWKLLPELARHFSDYFNQIPSMQPFISGAQNGTLTEQQKKAVNNYIPMFFQNFPAAYVDALQNWHGFGTWDVGSSNIPHDQFGMVHKGEIIVPRKFSDGIRSGELSLSRERKSSQIFNVTVNVQGSVMAERELVTCVYEGMAKAIQNRSLTPLPAGGF